MDLNVHMYQMSKAMKTQLYLDNLTMIFNPQALFSDGTERYRIPAEPKENDYVKIRFRAGRENIDQVFLITNDVRQKMEKISNDRLFDYYEAGMQLDTQRVEYYFEVHCGPLVCYYNATGVADHVDPQYHFWIKPGFSTPSWAKGAVFYQIYVDRFFNGDTSNDVETDEYFYIGEGTEKVEDWNKYPAQMGVREFYGGDIAGIWQKLDYLQDLGVEVIYFNPIFVSPSNHKYDIQDYDYIDPHIGKIVKDEGELLKRSEQGNLMCDPEHPNKNASRYICRVTDKENLEASNQFFADFVEEAHKRNIKVHTWFETFYVGPQNPKDNPKSILAMNPSWGNKIKKDIDSVDPSKSTSEHNGYFLDPANPYVQDFVVKLADEIITRYKPDGINLDYIRYPNCVSLNENSNWGYTDYARNDFQTIYGVDPADILKTDPLWLEWNNYRREQVTNVVKKIGEMGKKSNTYISAVIFPDRLAALDHKQQDWRTWTTRGYINGLTPLFLTCDSKTANKMMSDVINAKSGNTDFYAGLFVTFMGGTDEDLIRLIHEARKVNAKGVILFDYAHLNNKYINTLSKSVFAQRSPIRKPLYQPEQQKQLQKQDTKGWWIFKKES